APGRQRCRPIGRQPVQPTVAHPVGEPATRPMMGSYQRMSADSADSGKPPTAGFRLTGLLTTYGFLIRSLTLAKGLPSVIVAFQLDFRALSSERQPRIEEQRIVVARVAPEPVIVPTAAVELGVDRVLQADLQVRQRPSPGVLLAERHPVRLDEEGIAVRLAVGTAGDRRRGIQGRICVAPGVLPAEVQPIGTLIPIRQTDPDLVQVVPG